MSGQLDWQLHNKLRGQLYWQLDWQLHNKLRGQLYWQLYWQLHLQLHEQYSSEFPKEST